MKDRERSIKLIEGELPNNCDGDALGWIRAIEESDGRVRIESTVCNDQFREIVLKWAQEQGESFGDFQIVDMGDGLAFLECDGEVMSFDRVMEIINAL